MSSVIQVLILNVTRLNYFGHLVVQITLILQYVNLQTDPSLIMAILIVSKEPISYVHPD